MSRKILGISAVDIGIRRKGIMLLASAAVMAGATLSAGASSADAATPGGALRVERVASPDGVGVITWYLWTGDTLRGKFQWSDDPNGSNPGDSMRVTDSYADGEGIEADLITDPARIATTAGHNSPYTSPWNTGNLPEGGEYSVYLYLVAGGVSTYLQTVTVTA
jgi:hypothetical protein